MTSAITTISFDGLLKQTPTVLEKKIRDRVEVYKPEWKQTLLEPWLRNSLAPVLDRVHLACTPWEEVLRSIGRADPTYGDALQEFYNRCLTFNGPGSKVE